jgi:uncharacterized protein YndB with AHSA1/START domain
MSTNAHATMSIAAPPERVWELLTKNEELTKWFCEHADVTLKEKRFDFWGKFTPQNPARDEGRHAIVDATPGKSIRFRWDVRGHDSVVSIDLMPEKGGTHVALDHDNLPMRPRNDLSYANFWGVALENLRGYAERKMVGTRRDYSHASKDAATLAVEIAAPKAAVFQALVDPAQISRYIEGKGVKVEPNKGGVYSFGWDDGGPIRILDIQQDAKLSYSWRYEGEPDTVVTWTLEGSGGTTRLTLVHSGFGADRTLEDYMTGWLEFLNQIKFMVEGGAAWKRIAFSSHDYASA